MDEVADVFFADTDANLRGNQVDNIFGGIDGGLDARDFTVSFAGAQGAEQRTSADEAIRKRRVFEDRLEHHVHADRQPVRGFVVDTVVEPNRARIEGSQLGNQGFFDTGIVANDGGKDAVAFDTRHIIATDNGDTLAVFGKNKR